MKLKPIIALVLLALLTWGCGGAGGSTSSGSFGAVYFTDSLSNYDHVWVTVTKVVFQKEKGSVTAYNDPAGMTVDLASLRDGSGEIYAFLSTIPEGNYTGVTVTVKKGLVLVPQGASQGQSRTFAGSGSQFAVLKLNFGGAKPIGPNDPIAIDFDLASWNDDGTYVTGSPYLKVGSCNGIGAIARHQKRSIRGVVSGLSGEGAGRTFILEREGKSTPVRFTQSTVVCGNDWFVNGATVKVKGVFSPNENAYIAWFVRVRKPSEGGGDGGGGELPQVEGLIFNINNSNHTFDVTISEARNFTPSGGTVHVQTSGETVYTDYYGETVTMQQFYSALQSEDNLEVTGTYDEGSNTMTASRVGYAGTNGGG